MKKVVSFTIEKEVLKKWKKFTDENFINSSKLIEKLMKDYLGGKK